MAESMANFEEPSQEEYLLSIQINSAEEIIDELKSLENNTNPDHYPEAVRENAKILSGKVVRKIISLRNYADPDGFSKDSAEISDNLARLLAEAALSDKEAVLEEIKEYLESENAKNTAIKEENEQLRQSKFGPKPAASGGIIDGLKSKITGFGK
jgi:hypothetical protein